MRQTRKSVRRFVCWFAFLISMIGIYAMPVRAATKLQLDNKVLVVGEKCQIGTSPVKQTITWKSSKSKVATITKKGIVKAKKAGTTVITARFPKDNNPKKYTTLQVKIQVVAPKLKAATVTLSKNQSYQLKYMSLAGKMKWKSSNTGVVKVSSKGVLTSQNTGSAVVTVTYRGCYVCSCKVQVRSIANTNTIVLGVGENQKLEDTATYWKVQDKTIATISGNTCIGKKAGETFATRREGTKVYTMRIVVSTKGRWIAHRGYSALEPENTTVAFKLAALAGAWGIETDVRNTADGELILMHDATIDRTTSGTGKVSELTLADIQAGDVYVDAGNGILDHRMGTVVVATLDEYLDICKRYGCFAVIELKGCTAGTYEDGTEYTAQDMYQKIYQTIVEHDMEKQCWITSLKASNLEAFRKCTSVGAGDVPMKYIVTSVTAAALSTAKSLGNCDLNIHASYVSTPVVTIALLRKNDMEICVRGAKTVAKQQKWYEYGADYISSDFRPTYEE